jgi:hypothetical protein
MSAEGEGFEVRIRGLIGAIEDLENEADALIRLDYETLRDLVLVINEEARQNFKAAGHNRSGHTVNTIAILEESPGTKEIKAGSRELSAAVVEEGRGEVRPVKAKVLAWPDPTAPKGVRFSMKSRAVQPDPFYAPAVANHAESYAHLYVQKAEEKISKGRDREIRLVD